VVAGSVGLGLSFPIGLAITLLLSLVALSYFQTIHGYPSGGGSYVVARENLGTTAGLVAAAALLVGYLLTAAVSLTAAVEAIASAIPELWEHRVTASLALLLVITLLNLRGLRESGTAMAVPVYLFLLAYLPMLLYGAWRLYAEGAADLSAAAPTAAEPLTALLALRTFSAGCTALTDIEAISNGVPAFQPPESKNAGRTLVAMALLMATLFVGSIGLTQYLGIVAGPDETILSALARRLLGRGPLYYGIQLSTMLILAVAANTSFAGFPRIAAILAGDGFMPRQLKTVGDRLVFDNGILLLAAATGGLILLFQADTHALVPLFAVGVFLAFTLSQAGMVVHWWRERGRLWRWKAAVNGIGGLATLVTVLVVGYSKFVEGAWITILAVPLLLVGFIRIHRHYRMVAQELSLSGLPPSLRPARPARVVVPVSGVHRGIIGAMNFARSISPKVTGLYVELEPRQGQQIQKEWKALVAGHPAGGAALALPLHPEPAAGVSGGNRPGGQRRAAGHRGAAGVHPPARLAGLSAQPDRLADQGRAALPAQPLRRRAGGHRRAVPPEALISAGG
jgi:amino acid transporter